MLVLITGVRAGALHPSGLSSVETCRRKGYKYVSCVEVYQVSKRGNAISHESPYPLERHVTYGEGTVLASVRPRVSCRRGCGSRASEQHAWAPSLFAPRVAEGSALLHSTSEESP